MAVRTNRDAEEVARMIRETIRSIDPQQPMGNVHTLGRVIADSILPRTITAAVLGMFPIIGLLLAAAGIYAVISYTAIERRHEIAVRMAIGANRRDIIAMSNQTKLVVVTSRNDDWIRDRRRCVLHIKALALSRFTL